MRDPENEGPARCFETGRAFLSGVPGRSPDPEARDTKGECEQGTERQGTLTTGTREGFFVGSGGMRFKHVGYSFRSIPLH